MRAQPFTPPVSDPRLDSEIEARFQKALAYFRERGAVIFASYCRFFEPHAQPQQSLAKLLVQNGVRVVWLDGQGWKPYRPTLYFPSPNLEVTQLPRLPGHSHRPIRLLNDRLQAWTIAHLKKKLGGDPVLWIQGGIEETLAERLPVIDVFSFFDDPHRHGMEGALCRKAKVILTQNSYARDVLGDYTKSHVVFPPIEVSNEVFDPKAAIAFPDGFPEKCMGYIGSYFPHDFDLALFEDFIRTLPDWGFLLMGRTNAEGEAMVQRLCRYPNFHHLPWVPRSQVAAAWRALDVCLLLYRDHRSQEGAFPTKMLESLYFGVPAVATQLTKTADLEGFFPRSAFPDRLKKLALEMSRMPKPILNDFYRHFSREMSPKLHLARVAEWLTAAGKP